MHGETLELRELMVFLIAAGVVVPLMRRLGVGSVLGFLLVGLVIGPFGLARFADDVPWLHYAVIADLEGVRALAELGVVFLLFMIGLELSVQRLWAMRRDVFGLGGAQVIVTGMVITGIASLFDNTLAAAVVLGAGFALSSTAIVMQLLSDHRRLGTSTGQTSFSVLLFQDLAVLPILFMVAAFAERDGGSVPVAFALAIGQAALAVALILLVGRALIRPLFRLAGSSGSREMFLAAALLVIIGTAMATEHAGLSMALGAFLAGLVFAETEYRHAIEVDIEPFKGLLLGLFFVSVGMGIDLTEVLAEPFWLAASVVGLFAVKTSILYGLARLFGRPRPVALESALLLGQGGEFAFIIVGLAFAEGLMPRDTVQFMLIVTGLTMVVTPAVAQLARRLAVLLERREVQTRGSVADLPTELAHHVLIAGYGRVGQMLASVLDEQGFPYLAIDTDSRLVDRFRRRGAAIFFGDARRADILERMHVSRATALVVTMDSPVAAEQVVEVARQRWPGLAIYARARDAAHARRLLHHGASHVIPETVEASLQLTEMVLTSAGLSLDAARHLIEIRRQEEQAALDERGRRDDRPD